MKRQRHITITNVNKKTIIIISYVNRKTKRGSSWPSGYGCQLQITCPHLAYGRSLVPLRYPLVLLMYFPMLQYNVYIHISCLFCKLVSIIRIKEKDGVTLIFFHQLQYVKSSFCFQFQMLYLSYTYHKAFVLRLKMGKKEFIKESTKRQNWKCCRLGGLIETCHERHWKIEANVHALQPA
jgi:hypothetical protein